MSLELAAIGLMWVGLTLYALFAGADFGGGLLDLVAGDARRGAPRRARLEHSVGPIWEANHVWLIFVLVVFWTGFPAAFAPTMATLYVPLTAAAVGIILRGSAFAMRKSTEGLTLSRLFGALFALSSVITPFFLGTVAGAVASGRVPADGRGDHVGSWWNPTSVFTGVLAVLVCGFLAAVYVCRDAEREGESDLVAWFRARALVLAALVGVVVVSGIAVVAADAPAVAAELTGRGLPVVALAVVAGCAALVLVWQGRFVAARLAAGAAVASVLWAWGLAQYPYLLVDQLTIEQAAGSEATLRAMVWSLGVGTVLFVPPLVWLLRATQQGQLASSEGMETLAEQLEGDEDR